MGPKDCVQGPNWDILIHTCFLETLHLSVELDHEAYSTLKKLNFDIDAASEHKKLLLKELEDPRTDAYDIDKDYKIKTKKFYNSKIICRMFEPR